MKKQILLAVAAFALLAGCATADKTTASNEKRYPLKTCVVTDEKLGKDAFTFVHNGQELKTCCEGCREDFDKEPAKYLKKLAGK